MKTIVVFGATGFTGKLVVDALVKLGHRDIVLGGRDAAKLRELAASHGNLECRVADATKPDTLAQLVRGASVVVSTAGPFLQFGEPVVRAAIAAGAHFLDTTGEQAYMMQILERYHGACREKQLCVINAQAFEFAIGYCVAALLADARSDIDTIDVFNRVQGFGATRGTQKSGLLALTRDAYVRKNGQLVKRGPSPIPMRVQIPGKRRVESAVPFPGGECLHLIRPYPHVRNVTTNLVVPNALAPVLMAAWSARPLLRVLNGVGALGPVMRRIDRAPEGPSRAARQRQSFAVLARGSNGSEQPQVLATGVDPYGMTGVLAALGAHLLTLGPPRATGVISTDQAFGARAFLTALEEHGVRVSRYDA